MSVDNPLWGAPRIHGELLKLGFEVAQSSVAKYMVTRCEPPSQDGAPSCVTMPRRSPLWTYSLPPPLASTCSMRSKHYHIIHTREEHRSDLSDQTRYERKPSKDGTEKSGS
jgi:hypothetical protein